MNFAIRRNCPALAINMAGLLAASAIVRCVVLGHTSLCGQMNNVTEVDGKVLVQPTYRNTLLMSVAVTLVTGLMISLVSSTLFCIKTQKQASHTREQFLTVRLVIFLTMIIAKIVLHVLFCFVHSAILYFIINYSYIIVDQFNNNTVPAESKNMSMTSFVIAAIIWNASIHFILEIFQAI